jgi:uncharacterized protein YcfL
MRKNVLLIAIVLGATAYTNAANVINQDFVVVSAVTSSDVTITKTSRETESGDVLMSAELTNTSNESITLSWSVKLESGQITSPKEITIEAGSSIILKDIAELKNTASTDSIEIIITQKK